MTNILEKIIKEKKETLVKIKKDKSLSSLEIKLKNWILFLILKTPLAIIRKYR